MRLALLGPASSIHLLNWANALVQSGLEVLLISEHRPRPGYDPRVRLRALPFSGKVGYYLNAPALRAILREEKAELLHVHFASGYGTLGRLAAFRPYLLSVWGSDVYLFPRKGPLSRRLILRNLASPDLLLSTSRDMAKTVRELCGREARVTPFGIDLGLFFPSRGPARAVVGTVRALEAVYGIDILLRAFALLVQRPGGREARLLIVGEGSRREELRELAKTLGIAERTDFRGFVPHADLPAVLGEMGVFAALSRSESFCVAALEAEACGLPVVASRVGGLPEVVVDGETGFLVEAEKPEAAAEALERLLNEAGLREAMSEAAARFVRERFELQSCVRTMLLAYDQALSKNGRGEKGKQ